MTIGRNLGTIERIVRLLLGLGLGAWALTRPELGLVETVSLVAATLLVLNFVFGRCYLWSFLKLNSCEEPGENHDRRVSGG